MIVNTNVEVTTNITKSKEFSISKDSARLFKMLSDFLYSQKEKAVLHEISANACDAHKLVGKSHVPITVIAPTKLEPKLRIRDEGPGLCEDDVGRLLTTYGESGSHKRDSNEYFGAWGIGSKSVAAVSNTWQITSWFEGVGKEYLIFINEHAIPSLTKIREFESDETGLEVSIPIKPDSIGSWTDLFAGVYRFYDVRPTFKNITPRFQDHKKVFETPSFYVNDNKSDYYSKDKAILSYRSYSLDIDKVPGLTESEKAFANMVTVLFKFQTGELELSISRETLQYTPHTITAIKDKIKTSYAEYKKEFLTHLVAPNSLEYRVAFRTTCAKFIRDWNSHSVRPIVIDMLAGNTFNLDYNSLDHYFIPCKGKTARLFSGKSVGNITSNFTAWKTNSVVRQVKPTEENLMIKLRCLSDDNKFIIVKDDARGAAARVKFNYGNLRRNTDFVLIVDKDLDVPAELNKWVVNASALVVAPKKPRVKRDKKAVVQSDIFELRRYSFAKTVAPASFENYVYVEFTDARTHDSMVDYAGYCKARHYVGCEGGTILGIKKGSKIPKGLLSISEYLESKYKKYSQDQIKHMFAHSCNAGSYQVKSWADNKKFQVYPLFKQLHDMGMASGNWNDFVELHKFLKKPEIDNKNWETVGGLVTKILAKYPMLSYTDRYNSVPTEVALEYISLCEGVSK